MCNQASIFFFNLKDAYQVEVFRFSGGVCGVYVGCGWGKKLVLRWVGS
jgi:hypothetical protein